MLKTRKITAVLFSTALILAVILPCFFVSASAVSASELLSESKYKSQRVLGLVSDNAPYPDGCFIENQMPSGSFYLYNFDVNATCSFGIVDTNGEVIDSYFPFTWNVNSTSFDILSSKPIYRYNSSTSSWDVVDDSTTVRTQKTYKYVNGVLTSIDSNVSQQTYHRSFAFNTNNTLYASSPACYAVSNSPATYKASSSTTPYQLAPFFSSSYLSAAASVSDITAANNMASNVSSILSKVSSIKTGTDDLNTKFSSLNTMLSSFITSCNSLLTEIDNDLSEWCSIIYGQLLSIEQWLTWIDDDLQYQTDTLHADLDEISDQLEELMHGGETFNSESVFGTDESGLSDVTSDFEFSGSGIDSVTSTLGNSFRLIKVNFEEICDTFGLNDVIVLLLGFSTICFILGRVVNNRMRGA